MNGIYVSYSLFVLDCFTRVSDTIFQSLKALIIKNRLQNLLLMKKISMVLKGEPPLQMSHLKEDHSHLNYQKNPQKLQISSIQLTSKGNWKLGYGFTVQAARLHKCGSQEKGRRAKM